MRGVAVIVVLGALPGCRWLFGIDDTVAAGDPDADVAARPDAIADGPPNPRPDAPPDAAFCPTGYTLRAPSSCHRLSTTQRSWGSAEDECESQGAHLVVVDDLAEHQAIPAIDLWIGYSERVAPGFFRWVTDSTSQFMAWADQEPTLPGGASCVSVTADGWNDEQCDNNKRFVCEYDGLPANPEHF